MYPGGQRSQLMIDFSADPDVLVKNGRTRIYNIHCGGVVDTTLTIYDNTAASGTVVFQQILQQGVSIDIPGGLLCKTACFAVTSAGDVGIVYDA